MSSEVRVRFAPSPTGPLHIGGVRTALFNYLYAKKHGGSFILRIEDTDQKRFVEGAEEYIKEALQWLGIQYSEGPGVEGPHAPYKQSERMHLYKQYADQLVEAGHAYYAFDTAEELDDMRKRLEAARMSAKYDATSRNSMKNSLTLSKDELAERLARGDEHVVRIKIPRKEEIRFHDEIRGWVVVNSSQMDDKVLLKKDGLPTYHLANVVDDYLMKISHVIRGEEWLPSAPLHVLLYRYLGWEDVMPKFAHLSLLLKPDGKGKLSKRDGDRLGFPVFPLDWEDPKTGEKSSGYRESGYIKEAVVNMLALLGWHPSDNQEVFSMEELVEAFSLEKVSKSGAKFDLGKAHWFNHHYLMEKDPTNLAEELMSKDLVNGNSDLKYVKRVANMMREKVNFTHEIAQAGNFFFQEPAEYDEKVIRKKWKGEVPEHMKNVSEAFKNLADFTASNIQEAFSSYAASKEVSPGSLMQPLRVAVSGQGGGPPIFEMLELLGKDVVYNRIQKAVNEIPSS